MPKSKEPASKMRIDPKADKALAKVDQLLANPKAKDLNAELNEIRSNLVAIRGDPHRAR